MKAKLLLTGLLLAAPLPSALALSVIYDNTSTSLNNNMPLLPEWRNDSAEAGDDIWLAGTDREVVELMLIFNYRGSISGTFDGRIRFRSLIDDTQAPGDAFYDSGIIPNIPTVAGHNVYTFEIPHVVVPGHFVWTVQAYNRQGSVGELGPCYYNPATVGFSDDFFWLSDMGSDWTQYSWGGDPYANFAARVTAVPEPATLWALTVGACPFLRRRGARYRRRAEGRRRPHPVIPPSKPFGARS